MLIPRFTIRWLLLLMTVSSLFFFILSFAVRGQAWAIAVSLSVGSLLLAFLGYGIVFGLAALIASMQALMRPAPRCDTPFATACRPLRSFPRKSRSSDDGRRQTYRQDACEPPPRAQTYRIQFCRSWTLPGG